MLSLRTDLNIGFEQVLSYAVLPLSSLLCLLQDLYVDRPLPYLIGSQPFMEQEDVGLGDLSSEGQVYHLLLFQSVKCFFCVFFVSSFQFVKTINIIFYH